MAAAAPRNAFFFFVYSNYSLLLLLLAALYLSSSSSSQHNLAAAQTVPNVTDVLTKAGNFSIFLQLAGAANVAQALQSFITPANTTGATAFIPVDSAFTDDIKKAYGNLSPVNQSLVLYYHVIPKFYNVTDVVNLRNVPTLATGNSSSPNAFHLVAVNQSSSTAVITVYGNYNSANVTNTTVNANAFPIAIHPINAVLLPTEFFGAAATNTTTVKAPAPSPPSSSAHHTAAHATTLFISLSVLLLSFHLIFLA